MRIHKPRLPVTAYYLLITAAAVAIYYYLQLLPAARGIITAPDLLISAANPLEGLHHVWYIFVWGFSVQALVQITRVLRRCPRDADLVPLLKHGIYISAHAGFFEEIVFRLYAFLSFIIVIEFINPYTHNFLKLATTYVVLPVANFVTAHFFSAQFTSDNWALGLAIVLGSLFFRSAHWHYGALSKANVWVIGLVMFWLMFHYGLGTAIAAHILYDICVYLAIALTAPLQPRPRNAS